MAGKPQSRPQILDERSRRADGGEPMNTEQMSVRYGGNSLVVGLTVFAATVHDLDENSDVTVECYQDGIWIAPGGDRDE